MKSQSMKERILQTIQKHSSISTRALHQSHPALPFPRLQSYLFQLQRAGKIKSERNHGLEGNVWEPTCPPSPLELSLRRILGEDFWRAKAIWSLRPYDWGPMKTSEGELIDPKKHCTCLCVAKLGPKRYAYVLIFWQGCTKKPRVIHAKGYPVQVIERSPRGTTRHKISLSRLQLGGHE